MRGQPKIKFDIFITQQIKMTEKIKSHNPPLI
jgi:hypothetical protein